MEKRVCVCVCVCVVHLHCSVHRKSTVEIKSLVLSLNQRLAV